MSSVIDKITEAVSIALGASVVNILLFDHDSQNMYLAGGTGNLFTEKTVWPKISSGILSEFFPYQEQILVIRDIRVAELVEPILDMLDPNLRSLAVAQMYDENEFIGSLWVASEGAIREFSLSEQAVLSELAQEAALSISNIRQLIVFQEQIRQMQILHTIETAVNGSTNLDATLDILLHQGKSILNYDAAVVLTFNPVTLRLEYAASFGLLQQNLKTYHKKIGEGISGRAALERRILGGKFCDEFPETYPLFDLFYQEKFQSYFAAPIEAKGNLRGVLEIFLRNQTIPNEDWMDLLEIFVSKVGTVIYDAEITREKNKLAAEVELAYDGMCEAWVRELELLLAEPQGHTKYLAELSVQLGRMVGLAKDSLTDLYRGAMLHDLGMMRVPHSILKKPVALDADERHLIQLHPMHAYDTLGRIDRLRTALDIPLYHHERWDGSGYPFHFKEEQIPLPARIFAVVDVWDAMHSTRPFREALPEDVVRNYLQQQAGILFDPVVVRQFMNLI
jgi:transcriptional regulator with GAF, ATPase, and Fis domain